MSLYEHFIATRTKEELAKEAVRLAKEWVKLKDRVHELEHENFWLKAKERDDGVQN
jgi:hypothetical protein